MATIKDVAKLAGVSTTTVSHVINNTRFVAEEIKTIVRAAIKTLNYSPSAVAPRSLKVNHTKSIGLLAASNEALTLQKSLNQSKTTVLVKYIH